MRTRARFPMLLATALVVVGLLVQQAAVATAPHPDRRPATASRIAKSWRHHFAPEFVSHANARQWDWVRRTTMPKARTAVLAYAKSARGRGPFTVGSCQALAYYASAPPKRAGYCYVPVKGNAYYVAFVRRQGTITINDFGLED